MIRRYSAEPGADLVRLFETFVFAYWVGNGDLHQENLSLLADEAGRHLLSPTYDQVCTALYPGLDSRLGLPLAPGRIPCRPGRVAAVRARSTAGSPSGAPGGSSGDPAAPRGRLLPRWSGVTFPSPCNPGTSRFSGSAQTSSRTEGL